MGLATCQYSGCSKISCGPTGQATRFERACGCYYRGLGRHGQRGGRLEEENWYPRRKGKADRDVVVTAEEMEAMMLMVVVVLLSGTQMGDGRMQVCCCPGRC